MRTRLGEAVEAYVKEGLGPQVVEKSGSRRSSVERREEILNVALSVLGERGYRGASMREIAERAKASKETLYAWYGSKQDLFEELVSWQAEQVDSALGPSLERATDVPVLVLRTFAVQLQRLLLGERSVVINRAAISEAASDPTFARILVAKGRDTVVPKLGRYLEGQREQGRLDFADVGTAAEAFVGLTMGDQQIRRLLGVMEIPDLRQIEARAERAVGEFLVLFGA